MATPDAYGPGALPVLADDLGWRQGSVAGVVIHGVAEDTDWRRSFLASLGWRGETRDWRAQLDAELDRVAAHVAGAWPDSRPPPATTGIRGRT